MTTIENSIASAKVRSNVYRLLADGFQPLDEKKFEFFTSEYCSEWQKLAGFLEEGDKLHPLIERMQKILASQSETGLREEFADLFEPQGKRQTPPYEIEYTMETPQHSMSQQAELADISGFYKAFGFEVSEEMPDRVDSVSTELEFMYILAYKESIAVEDHEAEHIEIVQDAQRKFMKDHLGRWTGKFKDRLARTDCGKFYALLSEILDLWVGIDNAYLFAGDE